MPGIQLSSEEEPLRAINGTEQEESKFMCRTIFVNALACNNVRSENFDIDKAKQNSREGLAALGVKDGLQAMLAAQMLSVHQLQQHSMICAHSLEEGEAKQYYTNTTIKLANCLLNKPIC